MKRIIIALFLVVSTIVGVLAGNRGFMVSVDYERSNHGVGHEYSNALKLGAAYNIPILSTGVFIRPQINLSERWGDSYGIIVGGPRRNYTSTGMGVALKLGYRVWKYLEVFTGPVAEWYFYNSRHVYPNGATYAFWEFGAGIPISRFDIHASYRQHLNTPVRDLDKNRWSIGVSYRF